MSDRSRRVCCKGCVLQVKVLEGAQPSSTMRSQAGGMGEGSLAATQQRSTTLPGSPTQKAFNKTAKGATTTTTKPKGATLPVSLPTGCGCILFHSK